MDHPPIETLCDFPTPESSARIANPEGYDLVLADGKTWVLYEFVPRPDVVWDRLFDHNVLGGSYQVRDVRIAGVRLLIAHYDLPLDYAVWLIAGSDVEALCRIVETAMFGARHRLVGWSNWVRSAFLANGIDPASVPPEDRVDVLNQLVITGRAANVMDFTSAGIAAGKRSKLMGKFVAEGIEATPSIPTTPTEFSAPLESDTSGTGLSP